MNKEKQLIVVLGMHRSGTSTLTRGLQVLGVSLGEQLMPPTPGNNAKGFWEDVDLNALNIEILQAIGSAWFHLASIEAAQVEELHHKGYFLRAVNLLEEKINGTQIFGFKDPRVAKLLPFWKEVFSHCQFKVNYLLAIRNPLSVAKSLAKRDNFSPEHSYLLWLGHTLESLNSSVGKLRLLVDYDRLMQSPDKELTRISKAFGLKINALELENYKNEFLDQDLRHTKYPLEDLSLDNSCPALVREIYSILLLAASEQTLFEGDDLQSLVSQWLAEFERLKPSLLLVDGLLLEKSIVIDSVTERNNQIANLNQTISERDNQIANLNQTINECDNQVANLNQTISEYNNQIANLQEQIQAFINSRSWKLTKPVRLIGHLMLFFKKFLLSR
ncbi:hypothetical protein HZU77_014375 [Neisseriaceae bacterium TC5R-5]|nr:hypothetical protein [Neisseriaceae bacterium TC5R-5]